jgi:simple sugar transport system permease protein
MAQISTPGSNLEVPAQSAAGGLQAILIILARYREASIAAVCILLIAFFQFRNSIFLSSAEMSVVLRDTGSIGMIASGIVLVMITGEIDLSVGATFALAPYLMIIMATDWGWSLWLTGPLALVAGSLIGFINGMITVKFRIPSLITTLGTFFLLNGTVVTISNSQQMTTPTQEPFNRIFGENLYGPLDSFWSWVAITGYTPFLWTLGIALLLTVVLYRTTFGLHVIATGSNLLAAREIGVRTDRIKVEAFMILGALAAFAGLIYAIQFQSATPDAGSSTLTLQAIAASVIGGTALAGGSGTVIGALLGSFVVASLNNGLVLLGAQATQSDIYLGAAIVAAMVLNVQVNNLRQRRRTR